MATISTDRASYGDLRNALELAQGVLVLLDKGVKVTPERIRQCRVEVDVAVERSRIKSRRR